MNTTTALLLALLVTTTLLAGCSSRPALNETAAATPAATRPSTAETHEPPTSESPPATGPSPPANETRPITRPPTNATAPPPTRHLDKTFNVRLTHAGGPALGVPSGTQNCEEVHATRDFRGLSGKLTATWAASATGDHPLVLASAGLGAAPAQAHGSSPLTLKLGAWNMSSSNSSVTFGIEDEKDARVVSPAEDVTLRLELDYTGEAPAFSALICEIR